MLCGYRRQQGLSLIELMISLLITMLILAGSVVAFVSLKKTYILTQQLAYMQENAQWVWAVLSTELWHAGYMGGCHRRRMKKSLHHSEGTAGDMISWVPLTGYAANEQFPVAFEAKRWDHGTSEAMVIRRVKADKHFMIVSPPGAMLKTVPDYDFLAKMALVAVSADCAHMAWFHMPATHKIPDAIGTYPVGSQLLPLKTTGFYIKPSTFDPETPALAMTFLEENGQFMTEDLVVGIEDLRMIYGVDTTVGVPDGMVNRYVKANHIMTDIAPAASDWVGWDRVVSVQIDMVLRSRDPVLSVNKSMQLLGVAYHDQYLRQQVSATIQLRNY